MGLGNGNPNSGNKGSNWRYEYNVLKALECIVTNTDTGGGVPGCCPDTNLLLQQIVDNTNDIEVSLGAGDITIELADVEALITAGNLILTDIDTNTDGLEACCAAGNVLLTAIEDNQTNNTQTTRITDGVDTALVTAAGELNVIATAQPGVDIGDVTVNNGAGAAAVNIQDGGNSITVDAVDLDIRNLVFATDKVDVSGSTISVTAVTPGTGATDLGKAEDSPHASGDVGVEMLGVRNDTRGTTYGANGDYSPIAVDSTGAVFVNGTNAVGAQTITSSSVTDDNSVAAGATSVGFATSSDFTGTINGVTRDFLTFYSFEAAVGRTLPAIPYTTTTGSIVIDIIV